MADAEHSYKVLFKEDKKNCKSCHAKKVRVAVYGQSFFAIVGLDDLSKQTFCKLFHQVFILQGKTIFGYQVVNGKETNRMKLQNRVTDS